MHFSQTYFDSRLSLSFSSIFEHFVSPIDLNALRRRVRSAGLGGTFGASDHPTKENLITSREQVLNGRIRVTHNRPTIVWSMLRCHVCRRDNLLP